MVLYSQRQAPTPQRTPNITLGHGRAVLWVMSGYVYPREPEWRCSELFKPIQAELTAFCRVLQGHISSPPPRQSTLEAGAPLEVRAVASG